jgi:carboxyl-terminal processing protease
MIRTLSVRLLLAATLLFTSSLCLGQTTEAQWKQARANAQPSTHVLSQGLEYEQQGKWGEALSLYQQALRENPKDQQLRQRRTIARIHFDLDRRYGDQSFLKTIGTTGERKSLEVYAEVLLKIQSYYVDMPDWTEIANYGLASLEIALTNEDFVQKNLPRVSQASIDRSLLALRQSLANYTVSSRQDAYTVAVNTAKLMSEHLGLSATATTYEFVCGAISSLDPYSAFMSSNQYSETMSQIEGNFVGLGVELRTNENDLEIVSVIPKGPAGLGGIRAGDKIVAVDKKMVSQVGSERAADMLRGVNMSFVDLTLIREGAQKSIRLQRRRVEIPSVDMVQLVDKQSRIGYIRLTNFQKTTSRDFDEALWSLHRQGMKALIVDVRGNPGGLLSAAVEVADRFVGAGVIVSTRGRNPLEDYTHRAEMGGTWRVPLTVLVDENSASASEIFAAAIAEHKRGKIVGTQSYGKGSVQGIFSLNVSGGGVRLTTAKFYSPEGNPISQVGVKPDVEVQVAAKPGPAQSDSDASLEMGISVAKRMIQGQSIAGR